MSNWFYVGLAYGVTYLGLMGYTIHLIRQRRGAEGRGEQQRRPRGTGDLQERPAVQLPGHAPAPGCSPTGLSARRTAWVFASVAQDAVQATPALRSARSPTT